MNIKRGKRREHREITGPMLNNGLAHTPETNLSWACDLIFQLILSVFPFNL